VPDHAPPPAVLLKPGGSLLFMLPDYHLPEIFKVIGDPQHLNYHGLIHCVMPGKEAVRVWSRQTFSRAKIVIRYVKGKLPADRWVSNVVMASGPDKQFHEHGQSVPGMIKLVEMVSLPGDTILDPCCGGGATGEAALRTNRLFIGSDIDENAIATTARRLHDFVDGGGVHDLAGIERQQRAQYGAEERILDHFAHDGGEIIRFAKLYEGAGYDAHGLYEIESRLRRRVE
jgi:DNA methylase